MGEIITLDNNSPEIQYLCKKDKRLKKVIYMVCPITYETHDEDPYEFLVHKIIEQMISIKAGNKIFSRLINLCDGKITPLRISKLTNEQIKSIGTANSKVTYIKNINDAVLNNELDFASLKEMNDSDVFKYITSFKEI